MNPSVLIVDDEPLTRNMLRLTLERAGFDIMEAEDGLMALLMVADQMPDIMLLDVMMPNMDGLTVCRKLRSNARTAALPVILLSAKTSPEDRQSGLAAGANEYLGKPVSREELIRTLREVLQSLPSQTGN